MLKSIASWFTSKELGSSRGSNTLSSTRDAFSLPTNSPIFPPSSSAYASRASSNDNFDQDVNLNSKFTYPPTSAEDGYGYRPGGARGSSSKATTLLPLHRSSGGSYPPLSNTWNRIRTWLSEEHVELGDTLNWGAEPDSLQQVEAMLGRSLPASVKESFLATNGQELESLNGLAEGLFYGLTLLTIEDALEEWTFWREVDEDPATGRNEQLKGSMQSIPPGYIRCEYSQRGWFPLISDRSGNYLGVDMNPDEAGTPGQVIVFGRDFDVKVVLSKGDGDGSWGRWLAKFADELESGENFDLGGGTGSDGSDDGLGYDSYFFDGSGNSRGQGGGVGGSVGLRLTGVYKGWPVLEAWADRCYIAWRDSGLTPSTVVPKQTSEKSLPDAPSKELSPVPSGSISSATTIVAKPDNITNTSGQPNVASRAPAPLPVQLPTKQDISGNTPPNSEPPSPIDAEQHKSKFSHRDGQEMKRLRPENRTSVDSEASVEFHPNSKLASAATDGPSSILPSADSAHTEKVSEAVGTVDLGNAVTSSNNEVPRAVDPSETPLVNLHEEGEPIGALTEASGAKEGENLLQLDLAAEEQVPTVRLVGGGGVAGTSADEELFDPTRTEAANVTDGKLDSGDAGHPISKGAMAGVLQGLT